MSGRVEVEILGKTYTVHGDKDPDYVRKVAEYVDRKMREIAQVTGTVSSSRIAILAALNIADEYFALQAENEEARTQLRELTRKVREEMEQDLPFGS